MRCVATQHATPKGRELDYFLWLHRISASELSEKTGIHGTRLSFYRHGARPRKADHRKAIVAALKELAGVKRLSETDLWPQEASDG